MPERPMATVAILTFNGEAYLERLLNQVFIQDIEGDFEVLVIDSGSRDATLDIVSKFPAIRLHTIANAEFGHGRTRNLAARIAKGEFIAYLTHDAIPMNDQWLRELLEPFSLNDRVVGVVGKQVPRPGCFPLLKYEIQGLFAGLGPDTGTTLYYKSGFVQSEEMLDALAFYSDVNSAARRDFLVNTIPYRDVPYAEDQLFGRDVIDAGYIKAYAGRAAVEHSNDLTRTEYGKRIFDETVGLRRIGFQIPPMTRNQQLRLTVRGTLGDAMRILRDPGFGWKRRLYWLAVNPWFQIRKWSSYRPSTLVALDNEHAIRSGSLEHSRKHS